MTNNFKVISEENIWKAEVDLYSHDWYHTWDYHQLYCLDSNTKPLLFVFEKGHQRIAIPLVLRVINNSSLKDLTSVYGYPGFLFHKVEDKNLYNEFLEALLDWCNKNEIISIFSRLNSLIVDTDSYRHCYNDGETVVVDLIGDNQQQRSIYRKNYRNIINKLVRDGFEVTWSNSKESIDDFINIYNETMISLNANDSYFFDRKYYMDLLDSSDYTARIYFVKYENKKVCAGIFVFCNEIVQYHLSGTLNDFKDVAPTRLMIDKVREDATSLGYNKLHLGGGVGGKRDSLFNFKYGFSKTAIKFNVLKIVVDEDSYKELSNIPKDCNINVQSFFPEYRKGNVNA
ncbi:GNAT family N-acetyltransferase [Vibrio breoganii]